MEIVANAPGTLVLGAGDRAAALAAAKAQVRVGIADDDALLVAMVESALGLAELFTAQVLIAREMVARMPAAAGWQRLPAAPVRAIASVSVAHEIDIDADGDGWVRLTDPDVIATVTFTAGLATGWSALPGAIRQGAALLAAHLYEDRPGRAAPPAAVTALWRPYRASRLRDRVRA